MSSAVIQDVDGFLWILSIKEEAPRTFWKIPLGTKNHEEFLKAKLRGGKVLREQKK